MSKYNKDIQDDKEGRYDGEAYRIHEDNIDIFLAQLKKNMLKCDNFRYTHEAIEVRGDDGDWECACIETLVRFTNQGIKRRLK